MALQRRKLLAQALNLGYGTDTIPADSGGLLTGDKIGIHSFLGSTYISADDLDGADEGAKIAAAIAQLPTSVGGTIDLRALNGGTISSDLNVGTSTKPVTLVFGEGAYTLSNATIVLATGSRLLGVGCSRQAGYGTILKRTTGTRAMISATGALNDHVRNFDIHDLYIDGGSTGGHGIVLDYVDNFRITNVECQYGGASNAIRLLNEVWDFWVIHSSFVIWGDSSNYSIHLAGLSGSVQITDGHWIANQLGEIGNGNPILYANTFVLQQRFVDCKFHTTGGTMTHTVDWSGYRSAFIGCTFQADTASSSGGMVRIKNADNQIIGGEFSDVTNGDAIHVIGSGDLTCIGVTFRGTGAPSPGSAIVTEATSTGQVTVANNQIVKLTKGYDFGTGTATVSIGPSNFSGVTTEVDAGGTGLTWKDFDNGKCTATFGGTNRPDIRTAATRNPVVRIGGNTATNSSGYQGAYFMSLFSGGGQINELVGMGTSWLAGIGSVLGTNIEHLIGWCFDTDPVCMEFYAKPAATPIAAGHKVFSINRNGSTTFQDLNGGFAGLGGGPQTNGTVRYCSDCTNASNPCTGGSTGAIAKRLNGAWDCR